MVQLIFQVTIWFIFSLSNMKIFITSESYSNIWCDKGSRENVSSKLFCRSGKEFRLFLANVLRNFSFNICIWPPGTFIENSFPHILSTHFKTTWHRNSSVCFSVSLGYCWKILKSNESLMSYVTIEPLRKVERFQEIHNMTIFGTFSVS